jgi:hypothetical protein
VHPALAPRNDVAAVAHVDHIAAVAAVASSRD